jgi:hypothetical protein
MLERSAIVELGKQLRRRVIDQWDRYDATLAAYRRALATKGHSGRSADQFGNLLAFADLLLYDGPEPEPDVLLDWAEALRADELAETADNRSDAQEACEFLTGYPLQLRGGDEPKPISRFIESGSAGASPTSRAATRTAPGRRSRTTASSSWCRPTRAARPSPSPGSCRRTSRSPTATRAREDLRQRQRSSRAALGGRGVVADLQPRAWRGPPRPGALRRRQRPQVDAGADRGAARRGGGEVSGSARAVPDVARRRWFVLVPACRHINGRTRRRLVTTVASAARSAITVTLAMADRAR